MADPLHACQIPPMRATVYNGPYSLEVVERPDPVIQAPTDAVVRVCSAVSAGRM